MATLIPTTIHASPSLDSFTTLTDYQSQTPASFQSDRPILHYHAEGATALQDEPQEHILSIWDLEQIATEEDEFKPLTQAVDVFVSDQNLTIWNSSVQKGTSIPYPCISLHATQTLDNQNNNGIRALLLHIDYAPSSPDDDDPPAPIQLYLIPPPSSNIQDLYAAVTACSNLNPDPSNSNDPDVIMDEEGNEEGWSTELPGVIQGNTTGGLPPPFPGSGGWITAENVGEYFDADGNFIGGQQDDSEENGEEVGEKRPRPETNGHTEENGDGLENKRPRVD
ncbi:regulator of volume decrease after cellular swelling-domain-containing protein [Bisporella sp. PMI_857]|nr:regulator of volume decrease after cellular swelling-domain-containing protein [Bisporella sp. PMI_857]